MTKKITPETYEKMNEEFEEEGMAFRIVVPTQEAIDKWQEESKGYYIDYDHEPVNLIAKMWEEKLNE